MVIGSVALTFGSLVALLCGVASAQQPHSWTSHDKIALSYYFYWYNVHDGEHFTNRDGSDSLTNHPPADSLPNFSYTDPSWHQEQMQDMVAAGIDVALPVYWGDTGDLFWSQTGLRAMVTALQSMAQAGIPFPGIGMFLDTTSLWKQNGLQPLDVTTPSGKATVYGMVYDYFNIIPKSLWATIDGRPIIVLYYSSVWLAAYDQSSLDYVSQRFQSDFGIVPYIIRERSWTGVVTDAAYAWGAALSGPVIVGDAASVGPGYDDSAILNRSPHRYQSRECGFYQRGWDEIISSVPRLVFVETWNELHEATEVAATREYGRQYIDLTARNVARWKSSTGFATAPLVWMSPGRDRFQSGLRITLNFGDGVWNVNRVAGRDAVDVDPKRPSYYIYLDVNDDFLHAMSTPVWVTVEYLDVGTSPWRIEYDSATKPYTAVAGVPMGNTGLWKRTTFALPDAYFGGRENGGSDLRINDFNNAGEIHYFSRIWISKSPPSSPILRLAPLEDIVVTPGSTIDLPLTVASSDGSPANLNLARAPGFASLQSKNGAPVLHLTPSISDVQACPVAITILAQSDTGPSLPDATSFKVLVPNPGSGVPCDYKLNLGGQAFTAQGGTGTITITTGAGCPWMVGTPPAGVVITSATYGADSVPVTFQVFANVGGNRSGSFTIAGQTFSIEQQASIPSSLSLIGSMAHLAAEENWTTAFTLVNKGTASVQTRLSLFGDVVDASGNGPLMLPLAFPQQAASSGPLLAASFDRTLAANASLIVDSAGPQTPPVLVGSAQLAATGAVDGFAIFHQIVTTQEAVVPMESRNASSYLLAFDNTNGLVLGVALENLSAANAAIPVVIRDENGVVISAPGASISLAGNGHTSFVLSDSANGFPVSANMRGTIEFDTPAGGRISVLGLRFTPPNNALTTIPALANVGTGGGSIAHLASGGDGWQTTFVLVNAGTSAAQFTLSFFADQTGAPLSLPLSFPQPGGGTDAVASSVTRMLPAGATLVIVSNGAGNLLTGSAQLTTAGHISGFVIFRHNNQEAVVPLESRHATAYMLAFDNTNGTSTGLALNAVSAQQVNVPVVVRDDTGATIASDTITLNANGHYAFTLVNDRYPVTANIRGTIEFDTPVGAQIGALGIRVPASAAHTYTTLPALAK